eukprot:scaffold12931_cov117-Amphora_coffeaeformis.AAC.1
MDNNDNHRDLNNDNDASKTPPPSTRTSPSGRHGLSWSQSVEMSHEMKAQEVSVYLCVTTGCFGKELPYPKPLFWLDFVLV